MESIDQRGRHLVQDLCGTARDVAIQHFMKFYACSVYISFLNQANGPLKEDDNEEIVVNNLSNAMMGVYRDNPWLLDMLNIKNNN